jgi:hypothetical protein
LAKLKSVCPRCSSRYLTSRYRSGVHRAVNPTKCSQGRLRGRVGGRIQGNEDDAQ